MASAGCEACLTGCKFGQMPATAWYDISTEWSFPVLQIARRQFPQIWNQLNCVYWATFFPVRFALSPYLVVRTVVPYCERWTGWPAYQKSGADCCFLLLQFKFWSILEDAAWYDRWSVTLAQAGLCGFNCLMLWASVKRRINPQALQGVLQFCGSELSARLTGQPVAIHAKATSAGSKVN